MPDIVLIALHTLFHLNVAADLRVIILFYIRLNLDPEKSSNLYQVTASKRPRKDLNKNL